MGSSTMIYSLNREPIDKRPSMQTRTETTGRSADAAIIPTPQARPGVPIPYMIGRQRVFMPNAIWMGNVRPVVTEEKQVNTVKDLERGPTGVGNFEVTKEVVTTKYTTVGYNLSMQMSICLGPDVVLKAIGIGETTIWTGTAGPARTEFNMFNMPGQYIGGDVIFSGGAFNQAPDPWLAQYITAGMLPGYIGVCHIIIKSIRADQLNGEYPWFEVERFPNPLGLSSGANRMGNDINLATALADYIATEWGGAGAGADAIDTVSFSAGAATLAAEGNACSFQLTEETTAGDVIKTLCAQADGVVFENPNTGKVQLRLLRRSLFNPLTAVRASERDTSRINRWERAAWPSTVNKMRVGYTRRDKNYDVDNLFGYTFNAINDRFKANRSAAMDFPLCHTTDLAKKLLARELGKYGVPLAAGEVEINRAAGSPLPGDGVQVMMPDRVAPIPAFILKVRRLSLKDNRQIITFLETPTQANNVVFDAETGLGVPVTIGPDEPTVVRIVQAPMWLARRAGESNANVSSQIRAMVLPTPVDVTQASFHAYISNKPGSTGLVKAVNGAPYPSVGLLDAAIGQFDNMNNGIIPSVTILNVVNPLYFAALGTTGIREGRVVILIDDEILSFESATENLDGSWTLTNVHRALMDTAPQAHALAATCYVIGNNYGIISEPFTYPPGYTPAWRITSNTAFAEGNPDTDYLSWSTWDTSFQRVRLPTRPHDAKVDAAARDASLVNIFGEVGIIMTPSQAIAVTWRTRSRTSLNVALQLDAAENSEINTAGVYQKHRVMIRDSGGTLRDCGVTLDDANYNSLAATVHASTAAGRGNLFVRAEMGSLLSKYEDHIPVFIMTTDYFVSEDDADFYISENGNDLYVME